MIVAREDWIKSHEAEATRYVETMLDAGRQWENDANTWVNPTQKLFANGGLNAQQLVAAVPRWLVYPFQFCAQPKYASAAKLKGQRVAITSATGSLYAGTVLALNALGLKTSDVSVTPMGAVTSVNSALLAGGGVAAASHPPATYKF